MLCEVNGGGTHFICQRTVNASTIAGSLGNEIRWYKLKGALEHRHAGVHSVPYAAEAAVRATITSQSDVPLSPVVRGYIEFYGSNRVLTIKR